MVRMGGAAMVAATFLVAVNGSAMLAEAADRAGTLLAQAKDPALERLRESSDRFIRPVCSGAMYASVPAITSGGAGAARSRRMREAMPNPVSRTSPLAATTTTLPGLMSLWIRPAS